MRSIWISCLVVILASVASDAQASRCVDQVALLAKQLDVSIGAPGQEKATALDPDLGIAPKFGGASGVPRTGSRGQAPGLGNKVVSVEGEDDLLAGGKPSGKELKAEARSMLSSLLNAALAAGEEGRSQACFKQLNVAHAVSLIAPQHDDERRDVGDWR